MAQDLTHTVSVTLDDDKTLYKLLMWCGRHIAPNYELWQCNSTMNEVVFQFVHAQDACEFALTWA